MAYTNNYWPAATGNMSQNYTVNPTPVMNYYPTTPSSSIVWVQGESGAKAYPVAPGNTVLLMDSEDGVFYIKSTDASGIPQPLRTFDYTERVTTQQIEEKPNESYVTRDEFEELKKLIDDLTK